MLKHKFITYVIFITTISLFYGSTLFNGFVHDDIWQVEQNKYVKNISNIPAIFTSCIAEDILGGCKNKGFYYRPLQSVLYTIQYQIFREPWFFHLMNMIYLFIVCLFVFHLFRLVLPKTTSGMYLSLGGTVLFLVHPINSEVVNWVSATPELLTTVFILAAILFYDQFTRKRKLFWLILSAAAYLLALFAKETALFLVLLLPLYEYLFGKVKKGVVWHLGAVGLYLIMREEALGRVIYKYEGYYSMDLYTQIINAFSLLPKYLWKLIYPLPLSFQPQVLPVSSFGLLGWLGVFICAAAVLAALFLWKKKEKGMLFGLALIFLPLFPILVFINKLGENLFSERYLFLSSIGFSLVVVEFLKKILNLRLRSGKLKYAFFGLFLIYIAGSFWIVFNRNDDWKDNITSYQSMLRVDPSHVKAHFQLGELYSENGKIDLAEKEYKQALFYNSNYIEAKKALDKLSRRYRTGKGFSFYLPEGWSVKEEQSVFLADSQKKLNVEISLEKLESISFDKYLENQNQKYGNLINQGLAQIPKFEKAYVKVWDNQGVAALQFSLLQRAKVIKILVFPVPSGNKNSVMEQFNLILGSIRIH